MRSIDEKGTSKFAITQLVGKADRKTAWEFLEHLLKVVPYRIRTILTGVCERSCPPISCGVSDFRGADFVFGVEPYGACGAPVAGLS